MTGPVTILYYNYITWVWAKRRTSYRCSAKKFDLFPKYVIFIRDFKLTVKFRKE